MKELSYKQWKEWYRKRRERNELLVGTFKIALLSLLVGYWGSFLFVLSWTNSVIDFYFIGIIFTSFMIGLAYVVD
jgi:hypothetical protein